MMRVEMAKVEYLGAERLRRPGRFNWSVKAHEGSCVRLCPTVRRERGKSLAFTLHFSKAVITLGTKAVDILGSLAISFRISTRVTKTPGNGSYSGRTLAS